jgi:hypothetical protein
LPNSRLAAGGDQETQRVFSIGEKTNRLKKTTASSHILRYARPSSVGRVFFGVLTCVSRRSRRSVMPRVRSSVSFSLQHNVNARTHARDGNLANGAVYSYGILGIVPSASQVPILAVLVPPCDGLGKSRRTVWTHSKAATPILPRVVDQLRHLPSAAGHDRRRDLAFQVPILAVSVPSYDGPVLLPSAVPFVMAIRGRVYGW